MKSCNLRRSASALTLAILWNTGAVAQTAPNTDEASLNQDSADAAAEQADAGGDIVITALRREQRLSTVGVTVTAIGAEELVRRNIDSPEDLVQIVPGFQATTSYGGQPNYTLRGVGFNARYASATAPIGLYLNEAAVPYPYMSLGLLFDLERVEALKGPQGTLYGRNATGGLINFVSAKPTRDLQGGFNFQYGNYKTVDASAFASGPLSDSVRVRLALDTQNRFQGWQRSVTRNERLGELHQHAARLSVAVGNDGPFDLLLTGNYWKREGDTVAPQAIKIFLTNPFIRAETRASVIANPTRNQQADFVSRFRQPAADIGVIRPAPIVDSTYFDFAARASLDLGSGINLVSLTSYNDLDQRDVSDAAGVQTESIYQDSQNQIRSFSEELRLLGESDRFNWSVGGYYAKDKIDVFELGYADENAVIALLRAISLSLPQRRFTPQQIRRSFNNYQNRAKIQTEVLAGFANAEYELSDVFKLSAGGRYTRDKTNIEACTYDTDGRNVPVISLIYPLLVRTATNLNLQPNQCYVLNAQRTGFVDGVVRRTQTQNNFSWRVNLDVTPNERTLFYATVSRGFKAGGFPVLAASNEIQFEPVRQEKLTAYEVGTKLGLFDRALQLNLSAFYYDYTDKQIFGRVEDIVFTTLSRIDNIPQSREYGVEGEATWRITPAVTFRAAGVYLDSKINRYSGFDEFGVRTDFAGRPFAYTPEFQGNATLSFDTPLGSGPLRANGAVDLSYQSETQADFAGSPLFRIKDYALVGGTLGLESNEGWSVGLYVRNLFDTYYWTGVSSATETVFRYAGMPREYGVSLGFRF